MIKNKVLPVLLLIVLLAVPSFAQEISVEGNLVNASNYKNVYLFQFFGQEVTKFDSTGIKDGYFRFKYNQSIPRGFYLLFLDNKFNFPIILGNENIQISGDLKDFNNSIKLTGSTENMLYSQLNLNLQNIFSNQQTIENLQKQASEKGDKHTLALANKQLDSIDHVINQVYFEVSEKYPETFVGKISRLFYHLPSSSYIIPSDFNDEELVRGGMLSSKIRAYYKKEVTANVQAWIKAYEYLKSCSSPGSSGREIIYLSVTQLFKESIPDYAGKIAKDYVAEFPNSVRAKALKDNLPVSSPDVGEIAPDIILNDQDGKTIKLSSLRGQVVLLDFWASWCGPCRAENPNVVRVYHQYKNNGFTVYAVSLDNDKKRWLDAITKDGLAWNHVSDLKGWQSAGAALYKVNSIPATYLIDRQGKIIAKNLRGQELEKKLMDIFKSDIN